MPDLTMDVPGEITEGYRDGFNLDNPDPSSNRSHCYRHGFKVGRADRKREPAFRSAAEALQAARIAIEQDHGF